MQKRSGLILHPVRGTVESTQMTDRGVRYTGKDASGSDISIDVNDADMTVNIAGRLILVEGDYLERDDNERKYVICDKKEGVFMGLVIEQDGGFTLKYGRGKASK